MTQTVSVIVPTLNAQEGLARTLSCFEGVDFVREVLVVDGGSNDETLEIARSTGAHVIESQKGRGLQLAMGGTQAQGDYLLFLHADTSLGQDWQEEVAAFISQEENKECAAVFSYALDDESRAARRIERMVVLRCATIALPYGDQGLLIHRDFYHRLGGFKPIPLMEDVDIIRRIGRRRLFYLRAKAFTSPIRYKKGGYWRRPLFHLFCLSLYFLGVSPERIAKLYN